MPRLLALAIAVALVLAAWSILAGIQLPGGGETTVPTTPFSSTQDRGSARSAARIVVVVDNNPYGEGLETAWGLSIYVEISRARFLFDTGPSPQVLERNAERLGINLSAIDFIVVSHCHGDHTGGLLLFSKLRPGIRVYIPAGDEALRRHVERLGLRPVAVNRTVEVAPNVYVVAPLYGPPMEEAAAVEAGRGLVVLVGCSHPGAHRLAEIAVRDTGLRPHIIIGGFHLLAAPPSRVAEVIDALANMGFEKIYPIHCSGDNARSYLASHYPQLYGDGGAGLELIVPRRRGQP